MNASLALVAQFVPRLFRETCSLFLKDEDESTVRMASKPWHLGLPSLQSLQDTIHCNGLHPRIQPTSDGLLEAMGSTLEASGIALRGAFSLSSRLHTRLGQVCLQLNAIASSQQKIDRVRF